jgi:undecaprenyl-diphosphatase
MTIIQALILGIIQGITEFLPVSSSGHLVIIPFLLGWDLPKEQIFTFDVLIQIGTLIAVIIFYWKDLTQIFHSMILGIKNKKPFEEIQARTGWLAILATIPAGLAGLFLKERIEDAFTRPADAGALLIVTAVILAVSEKISKKSRNITTLNWSDAVVMGISQALSIFPGVSRSGSTISGGLLKNLDRKTAGQFAFLMAVPIMAAAGLLSLIDLIKISNLTQFLPVMTVGFLTAGIIGFFTIRWLLEYITNHSLLPFAIYCLILGSGTLILSAVNPSTLRNHEIKAVKDFYRISYSSSVQWMLPIINECGEKIPETTILFNQSDYDIYPASSDIHISYGELSSTPPYIYILGGDYLVPAAHKDNPITNLTLDVLRGLYQGELTTIIELAEECTECVVNEEGDITLEETFHIWGYPEESYLNKAIQSAFQMDALSPNLSIAPNPSLLQQALSLEDGAIGILPQKAIGDQLKSLPLIDMSDDKASIQILASSHAEPDAPLTALLVCLQEEIIE